MAVSPDAVRRQSAVARLQSNGFPIQAGPIRVAIHLRPTFQHTDSMCWPKVAYHYTHKKGSCPVAEKRCEHQELLLFEAGILDIIDIQTMGKMVCELKKRLSI